MFTTQNQAQQYISSNKARAYPLISTLPQVSVHPLGHAPLKYAPPSLAHHFLKIMVGIQKRNVTMCIMRMMR